MCNHKFGNGYKCFKDSMHGSPFFPEHGCKGTYKGKQCFRHGYNGYCNSHKPQPLNIRQPVHSPVEEKKQHTRLAQHKCIKGCGRNKAGRHDTCCIACAKTDGTRGIHDTGCDCRVPGNSQKAINACNLAMICTTDPAIPIIVKQTKLGQFEDNTQNGFMIRAWKALFLAIIEYSKEQPATLVTGAWGTGVYKNPKLGSFNAMLEAYRQVQLVGNLKVVYCHYQHIDDKIETVLQNATVNTVTTVLADMAQYAQILALSDTTVFLHNFANGLQAGGGAANGRSAQEETLCQTVHNLFGSLLKVSPFKISGEVWQDYFRPFQLLMSPNCYFTTKDKPFTVVSAAAPNLTLPEWQ